jgi:hypothetical protein
MSPALLPLMSVQPLELLMMAERWAGHLVCLQYNQLRPRKRQGTGGGPWLATETGLCGTRRPLAVCPWA